MATGADFTQIASQARRRYTEEIVKGLVPLVQAAMDESQSLLEKPAEHHLAMRRRDLVHELRRHAQEWHRGMVQGLRHALSHGVIMSLSGAGKSTGGALSLVDDSTIEVEIVTSRLSLAIMDRASWEFADLRARVVNLERRAELEPHDLLRAHVLSRIAFESWLTAGLSTTSWREIQGVLHDEFAQLVEEAYHETNHWLIEQGVLKEVDLRPAIKRSRSAVARPAGTGWQGVSALGAPSGFAPIGGGGGGGAGPGAGFGSSVHGNLAGMVGAHEQGYGGGGVGEETRMMTRASPLGRREQADAVMGRLNRLVARHVPQLGVDVAGAAAAAAAAGGGTGAGGSGGAAGRRDAGGDTQIGRASPALSPGLRRAIESAEEGLKERLSPSSRSGDSLITTPVMLDELHQRKQALKQAAATPEERATIEIVALLFQSILTEERIPASIRVWFARLQMPVLRVAVQEPDFFATVDHPARSLIDRMGSCVMGFDARAAGVSDALEKEIKRIVQVVEAYPDTGRRVFQTVLTEFEAFLEHYFKNENEASKKGVSLAQQLEQRETLAIQFTIELRRMLNEVPVQEGVRQFLFHVWADVLATSAVRYGPQGEETKRMKRAAADLIWSASAKVTREERGEVIRRLPPLLKSLREGMAAAGMDPAKQEDHVQSLNNSLAAAFTAKAASIPDDRLSELMSRLETLEELLPESEIQIDESMVMDLSDHDSDELEVVLEGGSMPTPAMLSWARELQVGSWYMLDWRGRNEAVQLAWQGMRKQLSLFVSGQGRCVLFQQQRLASFLQAGLLLPAQDEALTVRATRSALAKLDVDASRLLN